MALPQTINLQDVFTQMASTQRQISQDQQRAGQIQGENQELMQLAVDAAGILGELNQEQSAIDASQALELQQRKDAVGKTFGVDILDPDNQFAILARERKAATEQYLQNSAAAEDLLSADPLESPLKYILQQPFVHKNINAATRAAEKVKAIDTQVQQLSKDAVDAAAVQKEITTQFTAREAEIAGSIEKLKAEQLIRTAQKAKNDSWLADAEKLRALSKEDLNISVDAYKLKRHEDEFNARMAEISERRKAMKEQKVQEKLHWQQTMAIYNKGAKRLGLPEVTDEVEFSNLAKSPIFQKRIQGVVEFGLPYATMPDETPTVFSPNVGEAVVTVDTLGAQLPDTQIKMKNLFNEAKIRAGEDLKKQVQPGKKLTLDDQVNAVNAVILGTAKTDEKGKVVGKNKGLVDVMVADAEQQHGRAGNIYTAPEPSVIIARVPSLGQDPLFKELVGTVTAASTKAPTAQQLVDQGALLVAEGKVKPEQVAGFIRDYYKAATAINVQDNTYSAFGLENPKAYNAKVGRRTINLMDEQAIKHSLALKNMSWTNPIDNVFKVYGGQ